MAITKPGRYQVGDDSMFVGAVFEKDGVKYATVHHAIVGDRIPWVTERLDMFNSAWEPQRKIIAVHFASGRINRDFDFQSIELEAKIRARIEATGECEDAGIIYVYEWRRNPE